MKAELMAFTQNILSSAILKNRPPLMMMQPANCNQPAQIRHAQIPPENLPNQAINVQAAMQKEIPQTGLHMNYANQAAFPAMPQAAQAHPFQ